MSQFSDMHFRQPDIDHDDEVTYDDSPQFGQRHQSNNFINSNDDYYSSPEDSGYGTDSMNAKYKNIIKIKNAYIDQDDHGRIKINSHSGKKYQ